MGPALLIMNHHKFLSRNFLTGIIIFAELSNEIFDNSLCFVSRSSQVNTSKDPTSMPDAVEMQNSQAEK